MTRRKKRHRPQQTVRKLGETDGMLVAGKTSGQVRQALEINERTFHRWRNQYGGIKAEEAKRLKELEIENARLKKMGGGAELGQGDPGGGVTGRLLSPARKRMEIG
jgi:putative transposase